MAIHLTDLQTILLICATAMIAVWAGTEYILSNLKNEKQ